MIYNTLTFKIAQLDSGNPSLIDLSKHHIKLIHSVSVNGVVSKFNYNMGAKRLLVFNSCYRPIKVYDEILINYIPKLSEFRDHQLDNLLK
jgi:hypothetical protein